MGFASLNPSYARPRSALEIGRRLTSDPNRSSLGLLPSGPDPVGEWLVHRQPPGPISAERNENASRRRARSTVASTRSDHARALEKFRNGGEGFVPLLEHLWEEIEAVRHPIAHEMLDLGAAGGAQLAREGTVVVDQRIRRAGGDERGGIVAQVGPGRARMRVLPVPAMD